MTLITSTKCKYENDYNIMEEINKCLTLGEGYNNYLPEWNQDKMSRGGRDQSKEEDFFSFSTPLLLLTQTPHAWFHRAN